MPANISLNPLSLLCFKVIKGYTDICNEIISKFLEPTEIILEADKKEFAELFGELLKADNILKNFDEFGDFEKNYIRQADAGHEKCLC